MNSTTIFSTVQMLQSAFKLLSVLQFTAFMWPQQAMVKDGDIFDIIIVGAGTAGSVIANRLTEDPTLHVLLIEAGEDAPFESDLPGALLFMQHSRFDWNFTSEPEKVYQQCNQESFLQTVQGKMLGGTSALNYMQYARGYPIDFDTWAEIAKDNTWRWENVLPSFIKSEKCAVPEILNSPDRKYHGINGYLTVTKEQNADIKDYLNSFKEIGQEIVVDHNPDHPLGYSSLLTTIAGGHRQSSGTAFLTPIKDRPNLHVLKETTVTKIIINNKKATGVEALTKDGEKIRINARKEVIVSAGAFNSPKLLMLSGIGPKAHLTSLGIKVVSDLPVGENLQDHYAVVVLHKLAKQNSPPYPVDPHVFPAISLRGFVALDKKQKYPDYAINNFIVHDNVVPYFCSFSYRFKHEVCDAIHKSTQGKMTIFNQIYNLSPKSRGKVLLRSSNPADAPVIHTGKFTNPQDIDALVKYIQHINPVLNTTHYKSLDAVLVQPIPSSCKEFKPQSTEYLRCYIQCLSYSMQHFTSTVPMGTVLDGRLKVRGVDGLRVADASVMPTITRANPAATVVMIGEKVAEFIKEDNRAKWKWHY